MRIRLAVRLFLSYVVIIAVAAIVTYVTMRILAPRLFDDRMGGPGSGVHDGMPGDGPGQGPGSGGGQGPSVRSAFRSALNASLLIAVAISTAVAVLVAALFGRLIVRPIEAVRRATRRVAEGDYRARVPAPRSPELGALAHDVNSLATTLSETETRRVRLLGDVAHEMRTPLTALDGYVEGMIDGVFAPDPETLGAVSDELSRLHRLADDLASLSRSEEQRFELHIVDTDLAQIAQRTVQRLLPQFRDAEIQLDIETETAPVRADPARIEQVLTNVLGNALAATPSGGSVRVTVRRADERSEAAVTDTGRGLSAEDLERVFERFYRVPGTVPGTTRHAAGTGVGLTIARGIARAHGGDLRASSAGIGKGARFSLTLPVRS